jgi:hypothetical protein
MDERQQPAGLRFQTVDQADNQSQRVKPDALAGAVLRFLGPDFHLAAEDCSKLSPNRMLGRKLAA